ncbi:MAG: hypothetical protein Unbinned3806contig1000_8 [Prokaryotic dsDNA virus sp.]|nr:MAG: hypothetical protein Unbinned3806contig1000_8 [Prokaryotic dsDNA virus sp.]|tara:strand:+ start:185 stop:448 length:264 start_codon:yes stop_codon:yes gene_type:complete
MQSSSDYKLTDVLLVPNYKDPSTWDLRIMSAKWGAVGERHLKGEPSFPAEHAGMTLEDALSARDKWQEFIDKRDNRLKKAARKAKKK